MKKWQLLLHNDFERRALKAYFRAANAVGAQADQPKTPETWTDGDGKMYVVLRNVRGVLAVYRIGNDDRLRRLKRWPTELNDY